ncbi:hypothetical protein SAMN05421810_107137 [Amycolatopsis arida]|uniref:Uncharacterized protein n=1 Tax=Amycolatopsis arida TaxID=587909 RepID=A0A1I5YG95_9PSEU|nr:hypothetical protein [Amycolatopsis arida]TDX90491.1 hypothetical protein CLV69_107137 [Amycolatopsis arida]SFQ43213.1 hypothetical protein SAMN05421810_107137 [Amycolatopsis arida]
MHAQARSGGLTLDEDAADRLLTELDTIRCRVDELIEAAGAGLDVPLGFGDNTTSCTRWCAGTWT